MSAAFGPCTRNFDMRVMSITPTASRIVRCSSATHGVHSPRFQVQGTWGGVPLGANHSGYSQPAEGAK